MKFERINVDAWMKQRHNTNTTYLAAETREGKLVIDYYNTNYYNHVEYLGQGVYGKDGSYICKTKAKKPGKRMLLTNNTGYGINAVFIGNAKQTATRFFGNDPLERIKELEEEYRQEQAVKRANSQKARSQKDMGLFADPIYPENKIRRYAETKVTPYIYLFEDRHAVCTACGETVTVEKTRGNAICPHCGVSATVSNRAMTKKNYWEFIPVLVADTRNGHAIGAYYALITSINKDGVRESNFKEVARYVDNTTYVQKNNEWYMRRAPYFNEVYMGNIRNSFFVSNCYVIPTQFAHYLHKVNADINESQLTRSTILKDMDVYGIVTSYNPYYRTVNIRNYIHEFATNNNRVALYNFLMDNKGQKLAAYVMYDDKNSTEADPLKALELTAEGWETFKQTSMDISALKAVRNGSQKVDERLFNGIRELNWKNYRVYGTYAVPEDLQEGLLIRYLEIGNNTRSEYHRTLIANGVKTEMYPGKAGKWFTTTETVYGTQIYRKDDLWSLGAMRYLPRNIATGKKLSVLGRWITEGSTDNLQILEKVFKGGFEKIADYFMEQDMKDNYGYSHSRFQIRLFNKPRLDECLGVTKEFMRKMPKDLSMKEFDSMQGYCLHSPCPRWSEYQDVYPKLQEVTGEVTADTWRIAANGKPLRKTVAWLNARKEAGENVRISEYVTMINNLKNAKIPLTKEHVFPATFLDEQMKADAAAQGALNETQREAMQKISTALMNDKEVMKFMKSSTKYLVFVPEDPFELIREGERLHNCLRTYVKRVANGKTSIFFIREADNPDAAFFAMQYDPLTGKIIQLHNVNNGIDEHPEAKGSVTEFARSFAKVLRKINYNPEKIIGVA